MTVTEDGDLRKGTNIIGDVSDGEINKGSEYGIGLTDVAGTDKSFSDDQAIAASPLTVMNNSGRPPIVITGEITVAHKAVINPTLEAGEYRHKVSYVCVSTF